MGWDYFTYMSQPLFFTREIIEFMSAENKAQEILSKRNERASKTGSHLNTKR